MTTAVLGYVGRRRVEQPIHLQHVAVLARTPVLVLCKGRRCNTLFDPSLYMASNGKQEHRCVMCVERLKIAHRVSVKDCKSKKRRINDRMCEQCNVVEAFEVVSGRFSRGTAVCDKCLSNKQARLDNVELPISLPIPNTLPWHSPSILDSLRADAKPFALRRAPKAKTPAYKHAAPSAPNAKV